MFLGVDRLSFFISASKFVASRTCLQRLLACLNFTLDAEDLFF